jgi:hypothetical protein
MAPATSPFSFGATNNGLSPGDREHTGLTHWVPMEIRLDDERTLVLDPP